MKILLAVDGSKFTKKALAFLVTHESLCGPDDELVVLHVQAPVPPRVKTMMGAGTVAAYHRDEANAVLDPIKTFLAKHKIDAKCSWKVGNIANEIVAAAKESKAHMVVMGTHGHNVLMRAVMGSVAQRVVAGCDVPVLLVK
ncbi:universal stress protein [Caenimonas koreensis]|uniref:Universal stress protein n=1 Tax=Caenimonas koreensis DSM 17982 TaxID=1121255 RepID=A0A844ATT7_9BURK|nr:universal stress protein [Caenimonas koreensis]MRD47890.1 universal stress protein [Caenimonas koreensis DSM 17982]